MSHQRRGYAASAAARADLNGWPPTRQNAGRENKYSSSKNTYSSKYYENVSDVDCSPEPSSRPNSRRLMPDEHKRRPAPFLYQFDGDDSDSGDESVHAAEHLVSPMRSAYSEPVMLAPRPQNTRPHPQQQQQHRRPSQSRPPSTHSLDSTEREALLDRIRQLSSNEAETAASLARATAQNAALLEEVGHWRAVAKEAAASRRAAREALSDVSAENARLAAAYSAQRLEASALQEALHHERMQSEATVVELEHALHDALAKLDSMERKENRNTATKKNNTADTGETAVPSSPSVPASPTVRTAPPAAAATRTTSTTATWDQERNDLLSLLERLQEQLAAHAHQQQESAAQQTPQKRPSSGHGRQATPVAAARETDQPASTPPRGSTSSRSTPVVYSVNVERTPPPTQGRSKTPTATAPGAPRTTPTPIRTKFQMPGLHSNGISGSTTKHPSNTGEHQTFEENSKTPAHVEPLGVYCEASYESTTTDTINENSTAHPDLTTNATAAVGVDTTSKDIPRSHQANTPVAQTPPLSATRPSSGDARAATTPPVATTPTPTAQKGVEQQQSAADLKVVADKLFRQKRYDEALKQYNAALAAAETENSAQDNEREDENSISPMVIHLLCSRATALAAVGRYLESAADCCRAEKLTLPFGGCPRAVDLRAEAYSLMGAYDLASDDLAKLWQYSNSMNTHNNLNNTSTSIKHHSPTPAVVARLQDARRAAADAGPRNHYSILGVKSSATASEIKSAYRSLALRLHPDKAAEALGHETATLLFSLLSAAHATLGNTQSRRAYDLQLLRQKYVSSTSMGSSRH